MIKPKPTNQDIKHQIYPNSIPAICAICGELWDEHSKKIQSSTPTTSEWEEYVKNYIDFKTIEDRDVCLNWIKELLLSERERVREEVEESYKIEKLVKKASKRRKGNKIPKTGKITSFKIRGEQEIEYLPENGKTISLKAGKPFKIKIDDKTKTFK